MPLHHEALQGRREVLGIKHPDTLTSMYNLADLLEAQGDLTGAMPLYHEALQGRREVLGDTHPDTLLSMYSLAGLFKAQGDLTSAVSSGRPHSPSLRRNYAGVIRYMALSTRTLKCQHASSYALLVAKMRLSTWPPSTDLYSSRMRIAARLSF